MASVNMNFIFILSVILKGIGAVLEIALQILLTKLIGLSGYGSYSTWISGADLLFWVFFSGLIKCNTYYLSRGSSSLSHFKKLYYIRYMLPLAAVFVLVLSLLKRPASSLRSRLQRHSSWIKAVRSLPEEFITHLLSENTSLADYFYCSESVPLVSPVIWILEKQLSCIWFSMYLSSFSSCTVQ